MSTTPPDVPYMQLKDPTNPRFAGATTGSIYRDLTRKRLFDWFQDTHSTKGDLFLTLNPCYRTEFESEEHYYPFSKSEIPPRVEYGVNSIAGYIPSFQATEAGETQIFFPKDVTPLDDWVQICESPDNQLAFVVKDGELYANRKVSTKTSPQSLVFFQHSSFFGGAPVTAAGIMVIEKRVIKSIHNISGHYMPGRNTPKKVATLMCSKRAGHNTPYYIDYNTSDCKGRCMKILGALISDSD